MLSPNKFVEIHLKKLEDYLTGITSSTIIANQYEVLAVNRFIDHRTRFVYKQGELVRALRFFSLLNIQIGNETKQCEIMDFQLMWLASILALWKTESQRLYSQSFILVSKKNNKSGFAAILALYFTMGLGTLNAHTLMVGASREQARTLINYVSFIVKNSPAIQPLFNINKNIIFNQTDKSNNRIEIRSSEAGKINSVGVGMALSIVDEFAYHDNAELQQSIKSAQIVQPNHHQLIISTTSNNLSNPAFELYESAVNVLKGITVNDDLFTVIYTLDNKQEYLSGTTYYRKSNPAVGHTITVDALTREVQSAVSLPMKLETVLNHHFNCWYNQHQEAFISDDLIKSLMVEDRSIPSGSTVFLGGDFSSLKDLSALNVLWHDKLNNQFVTKVIHIFPNNTRYAIKDGSIDLRRWIAEGFIRQCETESLDENVIIDTIRDLQNVHGYRIQGFGFDPFNARILATRIRNELGINTVEVPTNFRLSYPLKFLEKLATEKKLFFDRSPVTRWQFQNLRIKVDNKMNYILTKSQGESVDGIVALAISMSMFLENNYGKYDGVMTLFNELIEDQKKTVNW